MEKLEQLAIENAWTKAELVRAMAQLVASWVDNEETEEGGVGHTAVDVLEQLRKELDTLDGKGE